MVNYIENNIRTAKLNLIFERKQMLYIFTSDLESFKVQIIDLQNKNDISLLEAVNLESKRQKYI